MRILSLLFIYLILGLQVHASECDIYYNQDMYEVFRGNKKILSNRFYDLDYTIDKRDALIDQGYCDGINRLKPCEIVNNNIFFRVERDNLPISRWFRSRRAAVDFKDRLLDRDVCY